MSSEGLSSSSELSQGRTREVPVSPPPRHEPHAVVTNGAREPSTCGSGPLHPRTPIVSDRVRGMRTEGTGCQWVRENGCIHELHPGTRSSSVHGTCTDWRGRNVTLLKRLNKKTRTKNLISGEIGKGTCNDFHSGSCRRNYTTGTQ